MEKVIPADVSICNTSNQMHKITHLKMEIGEAFLDISKPFSSTECIRSCTYSNMVKLQYFVTEKRLKYTASSLENW